VTNDAASELSPARPRAVVAKVALLALALAAIGLAYRYGMFDELSEPQRFARAVVELGVWGYAAFVVAYALLQPFGVPGTLFIVAAPLIWPWPVAFALSMTGTMAASVTGFSFARFVARDWVSARVPARLRKYEEALTQNALQTVFVLRLIFWMQPILHGFLGVSRIGFATHFWGSLLGYALPLLLVSYMGAELFDQNGDFQPRTLLWLSALLVASLLSLAVVRRFARRSAR
jgi:uncharacterized membrane protein YdjX (TVP38/TMEM64 family)